VLRHAPGSIGLVLDDRAGWAEVDALLAALAAHGHPLTRAALDELVATSPKQRFAYSEDRTRIRCARVTPSRRLAEARRCRSS
jgi:putative RNA 2'-phosphotransferase